jgi:hypothetical protein
MHWSDEQRALGEQMIVEDHNDVLFKPYGRFREKVWRPVPQSRWVAPTTDQRSGVIDHLRGVHRTPRISS